MATPEMSLQEVGHHGRSNRWKVKHRSQVTLIRLLPFQYPVDLPAVGTFTVLHRKLFWGDSKMITFQVNDMTCGHCVGTITQALKAVDQDAKVRIDLQRHLVEIEPGSADAAGLRDAIAQAGYTPVPAATSARSGTEPAQPSGCCCR